jgi:hypothetical protein
MTPPFNAHVRSCFKRADGQFSVVVHFSKSRENGARANTTEQLTHDHMLANFKDVRVEGDRIVGVR